MLYCEKKETQIGILFSISWTIYSNLFSSIQVRSTLEFVGSRYETAQKVILTYFLEYKVIIQIHLSL